MTDKFEIDTNPEETEFGYNRELIWWIFYNEFKIPNKPEYAGYHECTLADDKVPYKQLKKLTDKDRYISRRNNFKEPLELLREMVEINDLRNSPNINQLEINFCPTWLEAEIQVSVPYTDENFDEDDDVKIIKSVELTYYLDKMHEPDLSIIDPRTLDLCSEEEYMRIYNSLSPNKQREARRTWNDPDRVTNEEKENDKT